MLERTGHSQHDRFLSTGEESGTAPGDRPFRPDVEGLRAVAVVLVVLFHAGMPGVTGGYIGVDVFFVISGFVITGVLLRERASAGRISFLSFYGRRCRRILPAAALVIVVTIALAFLLLGAASADGVASDGKWAALFLANYHFASVGTNYLSSQQLPSPLQNYWSLAVEEQFYVVYPTLFALVALVARRVSLRRRLTLALLAIVAMSFAVSVIQTASNPSVAYFSPFARAWELALGGLVAVSTNWLLRLSRRLGVLLTWTGLGMILCAAFAFDSRTAYPSYPVALPVVGAALVIAGGVSTPRWGAETILALAPFRFVGRISYSLYLWHWPILILAAERVGRTSLGATQNLLLIGIALLISYASYRIVENPIRHARSFRRVRWASLYLGMGVTTVTFSVSLLCAGVGATLPAPRATRHVEPSQSSLTSASIHQLLVASLKPRQLPTNLSPPLPLLHRDWGGPSTRTGCWPEYSQTSVPSCAFGDPRGRHTLVLYGDSHAAMWFSAMDAIARNAHWRLVVLAKSACGAAMLRFANPRGWHTLDGEYAECDRWHQYALARIARMKPSLVILTQEVDYAPGLRMFSANDWRRGLRAALLRIGSSHTRTLVLGDIPMADAGGSGPGVLNPNCLSVHSSQINYCGTFPEFGQAYRQAEALAALSTGARYIDVIPWFCLQACPAVIGRYGVYMDPYHVSASYSRFLEPLLAHALDLSRYSAN